MSTKPTPQSVAREIKRRNLAFTKATAAQKRVLLAKDVLTQIKAKRFRPKIGDWVRLPAVDSLRSEIDNNVSIQTAILDQTIPTCEVCALGSLMTSCVLFRNQVTVEDYHSAGLDLDTNRVELDSLFDADQQRLIELAYEGNRGWFGNTAYSGINYPRRTAKIDATLFSSIECKAISWKRRIPAKGKRLVAIMQNIVRNEGTFKP